MSKKRLLDFEAAGEPLVFSHRAAFAGDLLVCHGTVVIGNMGRPVNVTATRSHDGRWNVEFQTDGGARNKALADALARYYDAQQYGELLVDTLLDTKVTNSTRSKPISGCSRSSSTT